MKLWDKIKKLEIGGWSLNPAPLPTLAELKAAQARHPSNFRASRRLHVELDYMIKELDR